MVQIIETIDVDVPVSTAYNQWTQFEEMYGLTLLVAIALCVWLTSTRWKRLGGDSDLVLRVAVWGVAAGVVGAVASSSASSSDEDDDDEDDSFFLVGAGAAALAGADAVLPVDFSFNLRSSSRFLESSATRALLSSLARALATRSSTPAVAPAVMPPLLKVSLSGVGAAACLRSCTSASTLPLAWRSGCSFGVANSGSVSQITRLRPLCLAE